MVPHDLSSAYRLLWTQHLRRPLEARPTSSRFCDGTANPVLYAAQSFETAFLEVVVRDRFTQKTGRIIPYGELTARAWVRLATRKDMPVRLLDLRGSGCVDIGAPTDAVHARNQAAGRSLAAAIFRQFPDVDGFCYPSRLTGADCFAIFARASAKLQVIGQGALVAHDGLPDILLQHGIQLWA